MKIAVCWQLASAANSNCLGVSSQVCAIDNGITCCYWSASLINHLRVLKTQSSLFKCCVKNGPNYMYWIQRKHRGSWVWVFLRLFVYWNRFLLSLLFFYLILYIFFNSRGEGATGREQPQGRKVTLAGPKSDINRAEKSHKVQNVTLKL